MISPSVKWLSCLLEPVGELVGDLAEHDPNFRTENEARQHHRGSVPYIPKVRDGQNRSRRRTNT